MVKAKKNFGAKKEKRDKRAKSKAKKVARDKRKEKQMHFDYEKVGSDDEMNQHEDLMEFGKFHPLMIFRG